MTEEEPLGFLVALTHRRIKQAVSARVGDLRLSPQQFWTLVEVQGHDGLSLGELAEGRRMDGPTASRVVFALARRGLVHSGADPADRRRARLTITPKGKLLAERLLPVAKAIRATLRAALTPAEREAVSSGLRKLVASLERMEAGDADRSGSRRARDED
jgi:DNA-binding MarR family transcriptional regulator